MTPCTLTPTTEQLPAQRDAAPSVLASGSHPASRTVVTGAITVRHLRPGEESPARDVFDQMSARSRRMRFLTGINRLTTPMLKALAAVSDGMHVAFVAEAEGRAIALARWMRLHPASGTAEVAFDVADAWQGRGLATDLLERLLESARRSGVDTLLWVHAPENLPVARLAARLGGSVQITDGLVERRTPIGAARPSPSPARPWPSSGTA